MLTLGDTGHFTHFLPTVRQLTRTRPYLCRVVKCSSNCLQPQQSNRIFINNGRVVISIRIRISVSISFSFWWSRPKILQNQNYIQRVQESKLKSPTKEGGSRDGSVVSGCSCCWMDDWSIVDWVDCDWVDWLLVGCLVGGGFSKWTSAVRVRCIWGIALRRLPSIRD